MSHLELATAPIDGGEGAALRVFEENAFNNLTMAERARRVGVSVERLRNMIRSETGMAPLEAVIALRVERSQRLLIETTLSVGQVARAVGFEDPAYFSRLFTRRVGRSASDFRAQQRR